MSNALLDTNIVIDWLRSAPGLRPELLTYDSLHLCLIVWMEVLVGTSSHDKAMVLTALSALQLIELTEEVAMHTVIVRQRYRKLKLPDAIIYATALVHGLTLMTRNTRDFGEDMPGVRIPYSV